MACRPPIVRNFVGLLYEVDFCKEITEFLYFQENSIQPSGRKNEPRHYTMSLSDT
jgi:hypothetical protein